MFIISHVIIKYCTVTVYIFYLAQCEGQCTSSDMFYSIVWMLLKIN